MKREVTIQEALTELAAAKIEIESMQQQLVLKDKLLSSKDEKITLQLFTINQQKEELKQKDEEIKSLKSDNNSKDLKILGLEERLRTQMSYRFGSHSEKLFEQWLPLFDDLDDFPENELLTNEELEELKEENVLVKAYKRRKCGRKKIDENYERIPIYHDIPESEKICGCGAKLVKVGEKVTERVNIIPERIYVEQHIYPVYACRKCEGSGDEDHPVFRQAPAAKNIIPKSIATPGLLSYIFINKYCNHMPYRSWKFPFLNNSAGRWHFLLSPLDCLPAKAGGAVNGCAYAPFILTVDWLGWVCYLPDKLEFILSYHVLPS